MTGKFEIITKAGLSPEEKEALFGWGDDLWGNDKYGLTWRRPTTRFVGLLDGNPVAHAANMVHSVTIDSKAIRLGGLSSVLTLPASAGKGYGSAVVVAATDHMRDVENADFGLLFCHPELVPFYEPKGWRPVRSPLTIEQPTGAILSPHQIMVIPFGERVWEDRPLTLESLPW